MDSVKNMDGVKYKNFKRGRPAAPRKRTAVLVSIAIGAAILFFLGATLTYTNFIQHMKNEFEAQVTSGVRLHDDYESVLNRENNNKDIYTENYGNQTVYIRIRLDEYMEEAGRPSLPGTARDDTSTWVTHIPEGAVGQDPLGVIHDRWTWQMGGQKWYLPTDNRDDSSPLPDNNTNVYDENSPDVNASGAGVKQTPDATVLMMDEWKDGGSTPGDCWVYDADGWAYWARPVPSGGATGLLLDAVNLAVKSEEDYYYAVNAVHEAATSSDFNEFETDGRTMTDDARELLRIVSDMPEVTAVVIDQGDSFITGIGTAQLTAHVEPIDSAPQGVKWAAQDPKGNATITSQGKLTIGTGAVTGDTFKVIATSIVDPFISDETTVTVEKSAAIKITSAPALMTLANPVQIKAVSTSPIGEMLFDILWTVSENTSKSTKVDENGVITFGADETSNLIHIHATSKSNPDLSNSIAINMIPLGGMPAENGKEIIVDNIDYRVLTTAEDGSQLLMTKYVYGDVYGYPYNLNSAEYVNYVNSAASKTVNKWYATNVRKLQAYAYFPSHTNSEYSFEVNDWSADWNMDSAINSARNKAYTLTEGVAFIPSISEMNQYFGTQAEMVANADESRADSKAYWIRSPGTAGAAITYCCDNETTRGLAPTNPGYSGNPSGGKHPGVGIRMALWVNVTK